jgi:hypothetical protein
VQSTIAAGLAALLVSIACVAPASGPAASPAGPTDAATTPAPTASVPVAPPAPSVAPGAAPVSASVVPDAGVLYVIGADDAIYRYDGESGRIDPVWRASTFDRVGVDGAYVVGRHGGTTLLGWDGTTRDVSCGTGYGAVSATGGCVSYGTDGVSVRLAGEGSPRRVLPADWAAASAVWSPDGSRLLLVRAIRNRPGPGLDPGQSALWVLEGDGRLREIYRPATQGILNRPRWSPDGRSALVWEIGTTSNSFAADGAGIKTLLVDIASGHVVDLGVVLNYGWAQWGPDGSLAYVSGGGRMTWDNKTLIVRAPSGRERIESAASGTGRVALAPDWDPVHGQLAWVSGPAAAGSGNGDGYIDGLGAGQRVGLIDPGKAPIEVRCGEDRVVEGLRWSSDGRALLLLCRKPGRDARPLELWLHRIADGTSVPLVRGLASDSQAAGFGFYGMQPSLFAIVAWSRATR